MTYANSTTPTADLVDTQEWRPVRGLEGRYEVSSGGLVRSLINRRGGRHTKHSGNIISQSRLSSSGYKIVDMTLRKNSKKTFLLHRVVCEAFHGKRPKGMVVNHKNGIKLDNNADNLEWVTRIQNARHAKEMGMARGKVRTSIESLIARRDATTLGVIRAWYAVS